MPSPPGYKRDYKREAATAKARGEQGTGHEGDNAQRKRARRAAMKKGLVKKGQDWDHKQALSMGGSNSLSNGRAASPHANRSFPRNKDGSMKSNT